MYGNFSSIADAFLGYFDIDLAVTATQRDRVGELRYRVYCEEFGFEPADAFLDKKEADKFDSHSLHCLITHRSSQLPAGSVRLVCASEQHQLPLEAYCLPSVYVDYLDALVADRDRVCEFSRLAVDAAFRKRPGEGHTRLGEFDAMDCSHREQRTFSLVGVASFLSAFALAELTNRDQIFGMMENNLSRLLRRAGILVQQAGNPMEYHGQRSAYFITTGLALENMRDDLHELYDAIHQRVSASYSSIEEVA